jgi:hypothetical protein
MLRPAPLRVGAERPLRVLCLHGKYENAAAFAVRTEFLDDCEPVDGLREVRTPSQRFSRVSGGAAHCELTVSLVHASSDTRMESMNYQQMLSVQRVVSHPACWMWGV